MARKSKYFDEEEIINALKPELKKEMKNVTQDMLHYSYSAIGEFYKDYRPRVYKRLGAMPTIVVLPKLEETKYGYKLTFMYSSDGLEASHSERSENIFEGPFVQGYHGPPWGKGGVYEAPQMAPSPWERILFYAKNKYNATEL